jgi:acyl carrier protein
VNGSNELTMRDTVIGVVRKVCPREYRDQVNERAAFADLGLDSLDRITLAVAVENATGRRVADDILPGLRTVSDLITHLRSPGART